MKKLEATEIDVTSNFKKEYYEVCYIYSTPLRESVGASLPRRIIIVTLLCPSLPTHIWLMTEDGWVVGDIGVRQSHTKAT